MLDLSGEGIKIHVPNKTASNFRKAEQPVDLNTQVH